MSFIANYTTTVDALKTVGEIQGILVGYGARQILLNYDDSGIIESLSFIVDTPYGTIPFRLPADARAVLKVLEKDGTPPRYCNYPQAVKGSLADNKGLDTRSNGPAGNGAGEDGADIPSLHDDRGE